MPHLTCGIVVLLVAGAFLMRGGQPSRALDDGIPPGDDTPSSHGGQHNRHAKPLGRPTVQNGSHLEYAGVFSSDARFRAASKFSQFAEANGIPAVPGTRQDEVPPTVLHSYERVVEAYEPPAHAIVMPETESLVHKAIAEVVTFVYGHAKVLRTPENVTTDSMGRAIVSDPAIPAVHVLDPNGKTSFRILGGPGRRLHSPGDVAVDADDNIYIVDSSRAIVLVYDQYGRFLREIGAFHGENMYQALTGIAIDRKAGHLYLADSPRHMVFILDLHGNVLKRVGKHWSNTSAGELKRRDDIGPEEFNYPKDLAVGEHEVIVLDKGGTRIHVMDLDCNLIGSFIVQQAVRDEADSVEIARNGEIYVSYPGNAEIRVSNLDGELLRSFRRAGSRMGHFDAPRGLWIDVKSRLYIADRQNARVQLFQLATSAGGPGCASQGSLAGALPSCVIR